MRKRLQIRDTFPDKAMELVGQLGDGIRNVVPAGAGKWLQTGAALGVARTGTRVVGGVVRRNPVAVAAAAAVVGAGVLAYVLYRKRRQRQASEPIDGEARRVARREAGNAAARARATSRTRGGSTSQG